MTRVRRERGGSAAAHDTVASSLRCYRVAYRPSLVVISAKDPTQKEKAAAVGLAPVPPEAAHPPPAPVPCGGELLSLGCRPQQAAANIHSARKGSSTHTPSRLISQSRARLWRRDRLKRRCARCGDPDGHHACAHDPESKGWRVVRFVSLRCAAPRAPRGTHHGNSFLRRALRAFQTAPL